MPEIQDEDEQPKQPPKSFKRTDTLVNPHAPVLTRAEAMQEGKSDLPKIPVKPCQRKFMEFLEKIDLL